MNNIIIVEYKDKKGYMIVKNCDIMHCDKFEIKNNMIWLYNDNNYIGSMFIKNYNVVFETL